MTNQGDTGGHAVGSDQSVVGRRWSAGGAVGVASGHQVEGCARLSI